MNSNPWYCDPIAWSSITTAIATIVYAVITIGLWKATKRSAERAKEMNDLTRRLFEASHRPYIGIDKVNAVDRDDRKGVDLIIKNFGTIPAKDLWEETTVKAGDEVVHHHVSPPIILCQGGEFVSGINLSQALYHNLIGGRTSLEIRVEVHFKGLSDIEEHVWYICEYAAERGGFALRGGAEGLIAPSVHRPR